MCGLFGVLGSKQAAHDVYLGLHLLDHRGPLSVRIASMDEGMVLIEGGPDSPSHIFGTDVGQQILGSLVGRSAAGHLRYATAGTDAPDNESERERTERIMRSAQPFVRTFPFGRVVLAHNGNLTNAKLLRRELVRTGARFKSDSDTEVILHLMERESGDFYQRLVGALRHVEGAYSLVLLTPEGLWGVRDPYGVRPLELFKRDKDGARFLSSESCAAGIVGAKKVRDVQPGEVLHLSAHGEKSYYPFAPAPPRFCIFELLYFMRPDSEWRGLGVDEIREALGRALAQIYCPDADFVIPVPDSGRPAAAGYADARDLPPLEALIRHHSAGRSFTQPSQWMREHMVKMKLNVNPRLVRGKRVILVDDSVVRGTTSRKIVRMVREAGAWEVHLAIPSPPTTHSCFYGIDTPERSELLAAQHDLEGMRAYITCDSIGFLPLPNMLEALTMLARGRGDHVLASDLLSACRACWSGEYLIPRPDVDAGL